MRIYGYRGYRLLPSTTGVLIMFQLSHLHADNPFKPPIECKFWGRIFSCFCTNPPTTWVCRPIRQQTLARAAAPCRKCIYSVFTRFETPRTLVFTRALNMCLGTLDGRRPEPSLGLKCAMAVVRPHAWYCLDRCSILIQTICLLWLINWENGVSVLRSGSYHPVWLGVGAV